MWLDAKTYVVGTIWIIPICPHKSVSGFMGRKWQKRGEIWKSYLGCDALRVELLTRTGEGWVNRIQTHWHRELDDYTLPWKRITRTLARVQPDEHRQPDHVDRGRVSLHPPSGPYGPKKKKKRSRPGRRLTATNYGLWMLQKLSPALEVPLNGRLHHRVVFWGQVTFSSRSVQL